jgi:hypothetical protein
MKAEVTSEDGQICCGIPRGAENNSSDLPTSVQHSSVRV